MNDIKITVVMVTYNHEPVIEAAIEGIQNQKCKYSIELLILDDNSPDLTAEIVGRKIEENTSEIKITYSKNPSNIGVMYNFIAGLKQATGDYIALCDGDDYWIDPYKLEKQISFLENNEKYTACFTNAFIKDDKTGKETLYFREAIDQSFFFDDVVLKGGGMFPTASFVFKNIIKNYPDFLYKYGSGDRAISLLIAEKGPFYYLNELTCVYRIHNIGVFSGILENKEKRRKVTLSNISMLEEFDSYFNYVHHTSIKKAISSLSKKAILQGRENSFTKLLPLYKKLTIKDILSLIKYNIKK